MNTNLVNIIFGLKVRQARMDAKFSLSKFAARCDLSPSYVTEIEKGRKYPKTDKILKMAEVLGKDYDDLVSIKLDPSLTYLERILSSPLLQQFPFEAFDVDISDLVGLFTRAPDKASALLQVALEIGRQYDMKDEHFLRAALRSYQEIHDNYFQDIEDKAVEFTQQYAPDQAFPFPLTTLEAIIKDKFGYQVDDTELARHETLSNYRSVFVDGTKPKLLINAALRPNQLKFILVREMGYQFLRLKERANTSAPDRVDSFDQVLNDFKASYFAGALLMPRAAILADIQEFFQQETWSPYRLLTLLEKYDVTPEMLLYRFSELIPQFFGIRLHFLRFHHDDNYRLVKQLNMNQLLLPSGIGLYEHHCRRWLPIRLIRDMETTDGLADLSTNAALVGAQISEFLESKERFLTFGFARPLALAPHVSSSAVIGFRLTPDLHDVIRFVEDPTIPAFIIHETCERCPLTADQCSVRSAEPTILRTEKRRAKREATLRQLVAQLQE